MLWLNLHDLQQLMLGHCCLFPRAETRAAIILVTFLPESRPLTCSFDLGGRKALFSKLLFTNLLLLLLPDCLFCRGTIFEYYYLFSLRRFAEWIAMEPAAAISFDSDTASHGTTNEKGAYSNHARAPTTR